MKLSVSMILNVPYKATLDVIFLLKAFNVRKADTDYLRKQPRSFYFFQTEV